MKTQEIYNELEILEMCLNGEDTDDDTRADILDRISDLEGLLEESEE